MTCSTCIPTARGGCVVKERWYFPGLSSMPPWTRHRSRQRNALGLRTPDGGEVTCVQVAGLHRPAHPVYVDAGAELKRGERFGSSASAHGWTSICARCGNQGVARGQVTQRGRAGMVKTRIRKRNNTPTSPAAGGLRRRAYWRQSRRRAVCTFSPSCRRMNGRRDRRGRHHVAGARAWTGASRAGPTRRASSAGGTTAWPTGRFPALLPRTAITCARAPEIRRGLERWIRAFLYARARRRIDSVNATHSEAHST